MNPSSSSPWSLATVAAALILAGCAHQTYEPQPIDTAAGQLQWLAGRTDDAALREVLAAQGVDVSVWPMSDWNLAALTGLALQRSPNLAVARAELRWVEASQAVAKQRAGLGVETTLEHHSAPGYKSSPWTVGIVLDSMLTGSARRAAQADEADALQSEAVELAVQAAWQVRQRVRSSYRELHAAIARSEQAALTVQTRQALREAQQSRFERGASDSREALQARQSEAEAALQHAQARDAELRARLGLASAVGVPGDTLASLPMRFADVSGEPASLSPVDLQRLALLNRLDLRAALARHAAADAVLRIELARQWPEIVLKPGYSWDQGDNRWSLGVAINLPPGGDNRAPIEQARARRDLEAVRVSELQKAALARLEVTRQGASAAQIQLELAEAALRDTREQRARTERRFEAGDADRIERLTARLVEQEATRRLDDARAARWLALGELEDALQRPLDTAAAPDRQAWPDVGRTVLAGGNPPP